MNIHLFSLVILNCKLQFYKVWAFSKRKNNIFFIKYVCIYEVFSFWLNGPKMKTSGDLQFKGNLTFLLWASTWLHLPQIEPRGFQMLADSTCGSQNQCLLSLSPTAQCLKVSEIGNLVLNIFIRSIKKRCQGRQDFYMSSSVFPSQQQLSVLFHHYAIKARQSKEIQVQRNLYGFFFMVRYSWAIVQPALSERFPFVPLLLVNIS